MNRKPSLLARKRVLLPSVALLVVAMLSAGHADEPLRGHFVFNGVKVVPIERTKVDGTVNDHASDKLTHWIRFDIRPQYELIEGTEALPFKVLNPTVSAKSQWTLDKPVQFKGKVVPAGTNLLKFRAFDGARLNIYLPNLTPLATHSATITRDFEIPADTYVATFEWTTKEGEAISDTVKVHIDVELP